MELLGFDKIDKTITVKMSNEEWGMIYHGMQNFSSNKTHEDLCECINTRTKTTLDIGTLYRVLTGEYDLIKKGSENKK